MFGDLNEQHTVITVLVLCRLLYWYMEAVVHHSPCRLQPR